MTSIIYLTYLSILLHYYIYEKKIFNNFKLFTFKINFFVSKTFLKMKYIYILFG